MSLFKGKEVEIAVAEILLDGVTSIEGENGDYGQLLADNFLKYVSSPVIDVKVIDVDLKPKGSQPSYGKGSEPKSDIIIYTEDGNSYQVSLKKSEESVIQNFSNAQGLIDFLDAVNVSKECVKLFKPLIGRVGRVVMSDFKHKKTAYRMIEKFGSKNKQQLVSIFTTKSVDGDLYDYHITEAQELARDIILELMNNDKYFDDFKKIVIESLSGKIKFGNNPGRADWILLDKGFFSIEEYIPLFQKHKQERNRDVARIRKVARAKPYTDKISLSDNYNNIMAVDAQFSF